METRLTENDSRLAFTAPIITLFAVLLISTTGCYQRNLAPSVEYSQSEVETLNQEIEEMEW